jgi:hypothetical protein
MRRALVAVVTICLMGAGAPSAAVPHATWSRWLSIVPAGVGVAPDGTVVLAGSTTDEYPGGFVVMRGLRPDGTLAWASRWRPRLGGARARDVAVVPTGAYAVGALAPTTTPDGCDEIGSFGWFVRKADGSGRTVWVRSDPTWARCGYRASGAVGAGAGLVAVATTVYIEGYPDTHGAIRAYDAGGDLRWKDPFEPLPRGKPRGYDADGVTALAVGSDGTTYAAGWAWRPPYVEYDNDTEAALMAVDRQGRRLWVRVDGEPGSPKGGDRDRGVDVAVVGSRVLYGAIVDRRSGPSVARIRLLASDGTVRWSVGFPVGTGYFARLCVTLGPHGTAFVGYSRPGGDTVLRRLGARGATTWRTTIPRGESLVDLAAGEHALYVLRDQHLTRYAV